MKKPAPSVIADNYFFPIQRVDANPAFDPEQHSDSIIDMEIDVSGGALPEQAHKFAVSLRVRSVSTETRVQTYDFDVQIWGSFTYIGALTEDQQHAARVYAADLLGGALRERLVELTTRGPFKAVVLGPWPAEIEDIIKQLDFNPIS